MFEKGGISCHRLPLNIPVCPVCGQGIKFTRGFTWINPGKIFGDCLVKDDMSYPLEVIILTTLQRREDYRKNMPGK